MSTFKVILRKAYKASKLKQCFRLGNQNSVDLNLIFPHSISVCEQFQYVWLSGPAREENIWISKNSHAGKLLLPAHTWVTHEKYCFPLVFINFVKSPRVLVLSELVRELATGWLWATQYVHGWPNIISSMGASQPSYTILSARLLPYSILLSRSAISQC